MKSGVEQIVGKTIESVVVAEGTRRQVFIVFTDGTTFEFYGPSFSGASGVMKGGLDWALDYAACCHAEVKSIHPPPRGK